MASKIVVLLKASKVRSLQCLLADVHQADVASSDNAPTWQKERKRGIYGAKDEYNNAYKTANVTQGRRL